MKPTATGTYQGIMTFIDRYDIRNSSGVELQKLKSFNHDVIRMTLKGRTVLSVVIYDGDCLGNNPILELLKMFGEKENDLQIVSRTDRARKAREHRDNEREYLTDDLEVIQVDKDRYDNKVKSPLLPDYKVTLWDLLTDENIEETA